MPCTRSLLALAMPALLAAAPCWGQASRLDTRLKALAEDGTFYGSVLVTRGGVPLLRADYGFADEAKTVANGPDFVYYAPWMDEPMISALAELAQEKGLLSLDAPIGTYLPVFKDKPAPSLRDLLRHTSGLPVFKLNMLQDAKPGTLTLADLAAGVAERPLLEPPGQHFVWSYNNYELAGLILETVTGRPYPALLSEWILQPLAMSRTGVGLPAAKVPYSYYLARFQASLALWKGTYRCSVGLYSTVEDLERFFSALSAGRLVSAKAYQDMLSASVVDREYGCAMGFGVAKTGVLGNSGDDASGFWTIFRYDPRYDLRILVLANRWMDAESRGLRTVLVPEVYSALELKE